MVGKKVLIVENEAHIKHEVRIKLQKNGFNVFDVDTAEKGLIMAAREMPDVIVTGLPIKEISGLEMIRLLQKNEKTKNIPFIVLSTKREFLEELGISERLSKPFSPQELLGAIEKLSHS